MNMELLKKYIVAIFFSVRAAVLAEPSNFNDKMTSLNELIKSEINEVRLGNAFQKEKCLFEIAVLDIDNDGEMEVATGLNNNIVREEYNLFKYIGGKWEKLSSSDVFASYHGKFGFKFRGNFYFYTLDRFSSSEYSVAFYELKNRKLKFTASPELDFTPYIAKFVKTLKSNAIKSQSIFVDWRLDQDPVEFWNSLDPLLKNISAIQVYDYSYDELEGLNIHPEIYFSILQLSQSEIKTEKTMNITSSELNLSHEYDEILKYLSILSVSKIFYILESDFDNDKILEYWFFSKESKNDKEYEVKLFTLKNGNYAESGDIKIYTDYPETLQMPLSNWFVNDKQDAFIFFRHDTSYSGEVFALTVKNGHLFQVKIGEIFKGIIFSKEDGFIENLKSRRLPGGSLYIFNKDSKLLDISPHEIKDFLMGKSDMPLNDDESFYIYKNSNFGSDYYQAFNEYSLESAKLYFKNKGNNIHNSYNIIPTKQNSAIIDRD